jgi:hypothetical protein
VSTSDAYVRIVCDTCGEAEEVALPFSYPNYTGTGGHYDHTCARLPKDWECVGDDRHECLDCIEQRSPAHRRPE